FVIPSPRPSIRLALQPRETLNYVGRCFQKQGGMAVAKRENHYEAAFEQFLRSRQVPYVAVDEAKRSLLATSHEPYEEPRASLKSLDFIISSSQGRRWLVDVKGRRFPSGNQKQYWRNWSTKDDLVSLAHWERLFGERFEGLFVFAYHVAGDRSPLPAEQLFEF